MECEKYMTEHYEEVVYKAIAQNAHYIAEQCEAILLRVLTLRYGFGEKRLNDVHKDFVDMLALKSIMGKPPKADDCIGLLRERYNIDFSEVKPRFMTYDEYIKENRNG